MPPGWHSHKVRVSGDIMITNREVLGQHALQGEVPPDGYTGGLAIWDVSRPEAPKLITNWDATDPAGIGALAICFGDSLCICAHSLFERTAIRQTLQNCCAAE